MHQTKISKAFRSLVLLAASATCAASFAAEPSVLQIAMADGYAIAPTLEAVPAWRAYDAFLSDADRVALSAGSFDEMIASAPTAAGPIEAPRMLVEVIRVAGYPDSAVLP